MARIFVTGECHASYTKLSFKSFPESRAALYRINHLSWWAEEMPYETEMECGVKTLNDAGWKADYIITHWFFGHYHVNEDWGQKETCLYRHIVELTDDGYKGCGLAHRFSCRERVHFYTYGFYGKEELTGTITHIDEQGGGFYLGIQPTANIRTDEGHYHKNIPFEEIRKLDEEDGAS